MGVQLLRFIEQQARISHRSEDKQTHDSWERFITAVVLQHGDWSVVEHASLTVVFRVDRGVSHELVRHRMLSPTQESTRFCNYAKKGELEFIKPALFAANTPWEWYQALGEAERGYLEMVKGGTRPQEARSVLPNALATTISCTSNLRNWRHVLLMRTTRETHPDMRQVMEPLLAELKQKIPLIYQDIEAGARQVENLEKAR